MAEMLLEKDSPGVSTVRELCATRGVTRIQV